MKNCKGPLWVSWIKDLFWRPSKEAIDIANKYLRVLRKIDIKRLPRISYELRIGKWPVELGEAPIGWEEMEYSQKHEIFLPLRAYAQLTCGEKAIERYQQTKDGMTDQMFDDYWDSRDWDARNAEGKHKRCDIWILDNLYSAECHKNVIRRIKWRLSEDPPPYWFAWALFLLSILTFIFAN